MDKEIGSLLNQLYQVDKASRDMARSINIGAVSYTHLYESEYLGKLLGEKLYEEFSSYIANERKTKEKRWDDLIAVSYTHLDVYKRQII